MQRHEIDIHPLIRKQLNFPKYQPKWSCVSPTTCFQSQRNNTRRWNVSRKDTAASLSGPISQNQPRHGQTPQFCCWRVTNVTTGGIMGGQVRQWNTSGLTVLNLSCWPVCCPPGVLIPQQPSVTSSDWHPCRPKHWSLPLPLNSWAMKHPNNPNNKVPTRWNKCSVPRC